MPSSLLPCLPPIHPVFTSLLALFLLLGFTWTAAISLINYEAELLGIWRHVRTRIWPSGTQGGNDIATRGTPGSDGVELEMRTRRGRTKDGNEVVLPKPAMRLGNAVGPRSTHQQSQEGIGMSGTSASATKTHRRDEEPSPINPFLPLPDPLRPARSSALYGAQHRAFFGCPDNLEANAVPLRAANAQGHGSGANRDTVRRETETELERDRGKRAYTGSGRNVVDGGDLNDGRHVQKSGLGNAGGPAKLRWVRTVDEAVEWAVEKYTTWVDG